MGRKTIAMPLHRRYVRSFIALASALVLLAGCSLFGDEEARVRFNISQTDRLTTSNALRISFSDDRSRYQLTREDFHHSESVGLVTDYFETATAGSLQVAFRLAQPDGDRIAGGDLQIEHREDWSWSVNLFADSASANPVRGCFGCAGYHSFPIDTTVLEKEYPSSPDSVYVVWGGNRIDDPVTY